MLTVLAFCQKDSDQAERLARWIGELGGCHGHELLLGVDSALYTDVFERILKLFTNAFDKVQTLPIANPYNEWATAANFCFSTLSRHIEGNNLAQYFLWLEPDSVPMSKSWIDALEAEYNGAGKPFMGDFVKAIEGSVDHMSGIGFYPGAMTRFAGEALISHEVPWDLAAAGQIASKAHFTELIHHTWKGLRFDSIDELRGMIGPEPVLYHSDKTGKLIEMLRTEKNLSSPVLAEPHISNGEKQARESTPSSTNDVKLGSQTEGESRDSRGGQNLCKPIRKAGDALRTNAIAPLEEDTEHMSNTVPPSSNAAPKSDPESAAGAFRARDGWIVTPWNDREESLAEIDRLAVALKAFCTAPRSTLVVRERLKKARVITKLR